MQVDHDFYLYTKWISQWMMSIYNLFMKAIIMTRKNSDCWIFYLIIYSLQEVTIKEDNIFWIESNLCNIKGDIAISHLYYRHRSPPCFEAMTWYLQSWISCFMCLRFSQAVVSSFSFTNLKWMFYWSSIRIMKTYQTFVIFLSLYSVW